MAYNHQFHGQELFTYKGALIFIVDFDLGKPWVKAAYYPDGEPIILSQAEYQTLKSADPEDLDGII